MNKNYLKLGIKKQKGLSLIELLVAMLIGLFLLVGITTSYLSSKQNSIVRDQHSVMEDNGRIAIEVMTQTLQHTGYASFTGGILDKKFINNVADVENTTCGVSSVVNTTLFPDAFTPDDIVTKDGNNNGPDSIGVMYLGDNSVSVDCSGEALPATCRVESEAATNSARIYSAFYLDRDNANNTNNLLCVGSRNSEPQLIADGVESMQILYGLDFNNNGFVDSYVNATAVAASGANGAWSEVVSIQIAVLMRSLIEVKQVKEAETFTLLDTSYTVPVADRFQRAVFNSTISIRNSFN